MKSGDIKQYTQLSLFRDLKDFNNNFEQWMIDFKSQFSKGELIALKRLVRFSASIAGVCYAKIGTLVAATHENGIGISRSTFKRMLTKAKNVGLLVVHNTFKNGKQGHSVYVFNRYKSDSPKLAVENSSISEEHEPPNYEKLNQHKTSNLLETSNIKNTIRTQSVKSSNQSDMESINLIPNWIDSNFSKLATCYFHNSLDIVEMYRIATIHGRIAELPSVTVSEVAVEALKATVYKIKQGEIKSIRGYFNGVCKRLFKREYLSNLFLSVFDD